LPGELVILTQHDSIVPAAPIDTPGRDSRRGAGASHFGIDAGVPITDTLPSSSSSTVSGADYSLDRFNSVTKRLLIGPSLRLDLPKGLGLEFDAIYQRVNYDSTNLSSSPEIAYFYRSFEAMTADRWQFRYWCSTAGKWREPSFLWKQAPLFPPSRTIEVR
jgi:hypothetical protein